jgi:hypothetical protein
LRIIGLVLTLFLLFGITYVAVSARTPAFPGAEVAVIIGSILGGPILLKRALTMPSLPEPEPGVDGESGSDSDLGLGSVGLEPEPEHQWPSGRGEI